MQILSLSCVYPSPAQPTLGTFVRARLAWLAQHVPVRVLAPVAVVEYGNAAQRRPAAIPFQATEDGVDVLRPRWFYPPFGGAANAVFLAARLLPLVRRLHRESPFGLIDAHFAYPDGIAAALLGRALGLRYSITLRGNEPMHAAYPVRGRAIRWAIRNAAQIIAVSSRLEQFAIASGAAPKRVCTIPNGVDASLFHPRPATGVFEKIGIPAGAPVILSAGYLIERKGHQHIIRALSGLRDTGSPAHVVIAGGPGAEGDYRSTLQSLVRELRLNERVHFTGAVPPATLADFISEASVLCLASSREGWPNVVNEALACGIPVIASDIGGVPDMIPSAEYGIIVPAVTAESFQSAIQTALDRTWDRQAIAAWGMSRSWEQVAREVHHALSLAVHDGRSA